MDTNRIASLSVLIFVMFSMSLAATLPSYGQSSTDEKSSVVEKIPQEQWYYRWEHSPVNDQNLPLWMDASDDEWKLFGNGSDFKTTQQGSHTLWFMISLPDGDWENPALWIPPVMHAMKVYQDHQRIYQFGDFRPSGDDRFSTARWHLVPLEGNIQNVTVFLRIYSGNSRNIGFLGFGFNTTEVWLGSQVNLISSIIKLDPAGSVMGFLYIGVSLFAVLLYFSRKRQDKYITFSFAALVFWSGVGELAEAPFIQLFVESPAVRYYARFSPFYLGTIAFFLFCEQVLGSGYKRVVRRMWQLHVLISVIGFLLDVTNVFPIPYIVPYLFALLLVEFAIIVPISVNAAYKGSFEARVFSVGMAIVALFVINDILIDFGVIPMWFLFSTWGTMIFIISLGYILEHRFAEAQRQLEDYSLTLEQKVEERTQELEKAQSQMVMQAKMASLGDLVAGLAHEINNPIGAIISAADVTSRGIHKLRDKTQPQQRTLEMMETNNAMITTAGDRISRIVQSLKSFAALDEALFQRVDIRDNIDTTLTLVYHELRNKAEVIKEYGDIPKIQCYPNELNQAFMNLLRNAGQAIEQQGTITITTYADDSQVYVRILDTGKGIPQEEIPKIFNPGFTNWHAGVGKGLGLAIVYNIIQKHNGGIEVDSKVGEGTAITINIPIEQIQ